MLNGNNQSDKTVAQLGLEVHTIRAEKLLRWVGTRGLKGEVRTEDG